MQEALVQQCSDDQERLQAMKLSSLAEFAAGAGHEINNPLAVISGQAQYVLKQLDWLDGPADEIENIGEYLENLRPKIVPSLHKIIGNSADSFHPDRFDAVRTSKRSQVANCLSEQAGA